MIKLGDKVRIIRTIENLDPGTTFTVERFGAQKHTCWLTSNTDPTDHFLAHETDLVLVESGTKEYCNRWTKPLINPGFNWTPNET